MPSSYDPLSGHLLMMANLMIPLLPDVYQLAINPSTHVPQQNISHSNHNSFPICSLIPYLSN